MFNNFSYNVTDTSGKWKVDHVVKLSALSLIIKKWPRPLIHYQPAPVDDLTVAAGFEFVHVRVFPPNFVRPSTARAKSTKSSFWQSAMVINQYE